MKSICNLIISLSFVQTYAPIYGLPVALENPGAEIVKKDNAKMPAASPVWNSAGVDASYSRDTKVKRSGKASFHIVNRGNPNDVERKHPQTALFNLCVPVIPGPTYTVTGFVKTRNLKNDAGIHLRFRTPKGWVEGIHRNGVISGTNDWTKVESQATAPQEATTVKIFLSVRHAGEAWFDDITVTDNLETYAKRRFDKLHGKVSKLAAEAKSMRTVFSAEELKHLEQAKRKARDFLERATKLTPQSVLSTESRLEFVQAGENIELVIKRHYRTMSVQKAVRQARAIEGKDPSVLIGFVPSTVHVFLEDLPIDFEISDRTELLAVRGETESVQLVILPRRQDLQQVRVSVSELKSAEAVIPSDAVAIKPVGFVKIEQQPTSPYPREAEYRGWWPDPLLENFPFEVKKETSQPVWFEVRVPREAPPETYEAKITVTAAGGFMRSFKLVVKVSKVTLPKEWHFKNLLSFANLWTVPFYKERWTEELQEKFFQFLLDRRINVISMYQNESYETAENLIRFAKRGQNVLMLAYNSPEAHIKKSNAKNLRARLDRMFPEMKKANLLDRCIVYGWDERGPEYHDEIRYCAEMLQKDYGSLPLLTAATDATYGTASSLAGLSNILYCPQMQTYDHELATRARAKGSHVRWWYETRWTIDDPLIRSRMIPWQTYKAGHEGFLFWCINRWAGNDKPVFDAEHPTIRTNWNPALDGVCPNSSAMYVYPGKDGPISSLRLENFRDGIEDYELLLLGRRLIAEAEKNGKGDSTTVSRLRQAVELPDNFVKSHTEFSTDPANLSSRRRTIIQAIERAID